ncbi:MAG: T9SS C-terminal target domain-containing protein [Bacteroidetes bacterium]|nr:MAG: T9SS C-terminal target domain-containing protein [Bacteroidota bacterium]TAG87759.1 MAG: T9SS C-terminal target domain-containing protein [Bacteroidota bacterium]
MKKNIFTTFLSIFFIFTHLFGQDLSEKKIKMKQMTKEIKEYQQKNMLPIVQEQRKKLEMLLSNDDKKIIEEIRNFMKENKRGYYGEKNKEIRQKIKDIVHKNQTIIAQNFVAIESQQQKWRDEIKNIQKKYISEENIQHHFYRGKNKNLAIFLMPKNKKTDTRFLLFDYNEPTEKKSKVERNKVETTLNIFPNPVKSISYLMYELDNVALVNINLINAKGEILNNLVKNEQLKGQQKHEFDLTNLEKGIYFYQINIDNKIINKKIIKE